MKKTWTKTILPIILIDGLKIFLKKKEVKYFPKVSLDEGLKKVLWYSYNNYEDNL